MESFWRRATPYSFAQKAPSITCTKNLVAPRPKWSPTGSRRCSKALATERARGIHPPKQSFQPSQPLRRSRLCGGRTSNLGGRRRAKASATERLRRIPFPHSSSDAKVLLWTTASTGKAHGFLRRRVKVNFQHTNKKRSAKNKNSCKWSWQLSAI